MAQILGLGYIGFESPNARDWESFGPAIPGFAVGEPGPAGSVRLRMDDRHHRFAIHPGERDRLAYVGWETAGKPAFEDVVEQLRRAGVVVKEGTAEECAERAVAGFAHFQDATGHRHEIFHGQANHDRSFLPGRPHRGFVTGRHGMGHVVVFGGRRQEAADLWTQTLGFRMSVEADVPGVGGIRFMTCGPRHHSLGIIDAFGRFGLQHVFVECADLDDVGIAWDRAKSQGLEIPIDLGRHRGDYALSFYVLTPSGFMLEIGWGPTDIDELTYDPQTSFFGEGDPGSVWGHKTTGEPQIILAPPNVVTISDDGTAT